MTEYTATMKSGRTWILIGNFAESASGLRAVFHEEEDSSESTPFQVADSGHMPLKAAKLVYDYFRAEADDDEVVQVEELKPTLPA